MTAFVLVPVAWLGGWAWRDVTPRLRAAGHEVYTPTLTGLGERRHLARPDVDLDTHIQDVVNVLEYEDLRDVVLVGHSYAGIVVTGVADRAPDRPRLPRHQSARSQAANRAAGSRAWRRLAAPATLLGRARGDRRQSGGCGRRLAQAVSCPSRRPAVRYLYSAVAAREPCPRGVAEAADLVQLPVGSGTRDDRRRTSLVSRAGRPGVAAPRAADRPLADVLEAERAGRPPVPARLALDHDEPGVTTPDRTVAT
jgi:pimeloyl-ACP methyl ester carboxylesterase